MKNKPVKTVVLIPDGAADEARTELGGKTPLQAASTPNFDRLASKGEIGLVQTIPVGFPPGSDVANLCVLGYDPNRYYSGRAPLEAASLGIDLKETDVAFRCNLVYIEDGIMRDFSAGHIETGEARELISFLSENLKDSDAEFHPGLSYRHIMVSPGRAVGADCTPPHDITGKPVDSYLPEGEDSGWLRSLMDDSLRLLSGHPINEKREAEGKRPANMIWLWGQGTAPRLPGMKELYGINGSVISAVDLVKGLGKYAGLEIVDVPGVTGFLDTDYEAKGRYAILELDHKNFVYVHVEAPDEASHMGDSDAKVTAIERIDAELLGPLMEGISKWPDHRILALPDHATPLEIKTHTTDPVPFVSFRSTSVRDLDQSFDEQSAARSGNFFKKGWQLMEWFLGQ